MSEIILFLIQHGYVLLFFWVLADQLGLPLPVAPLLLAAGALAGGGQLDLLTIVLLTISASLLSSMAWYEAGRHRGSAVLNLLCRMSLEPSVCVRQTKDLFSRYGSRSLLIARFIPGLNALAAPIAGIFAMPRLRFLLLSSLGACLWAGSFIGLGYLFSHQLEQTAKLVLRLGSWVALLLIVPLIAYLGFKYLQRRRSLRKVLTARITPEELKQKLDAGDEVAIIDLRPALDLCTQPQTLPGALRLAPEDLEQRHNEIPRDREVILYCT